MTICQCSFFCFKYIEHKLATEPLLPDVKAMITGLGKHSKDYLLAEFEEAKLSKDELYQLIESSKQNGANYATSSKEYKAAVATRKTQCQTHRCDPTPASLGACRIDGKARSTLAAHTPQSSPTPATI